VAFFVLQMLLAGATLLVAKALKNRRKLHATVLIFVASVFLHAIGLILHLHYYRIYADVGAADENVLATGTAFMACADTCMVMVLILIAKGWTIVRRKISIPGRIKVSAARLACARASANAKATWVVRPRQRGGRCASELSATEGDVGVVRSRESERGVVRANERERKATLVPRAAREAVPSLCSLGVPPCTLFAASCLPPHQIAVFTTTYFMCSLTVIAWRYNTVNSATELYYYESSAGALFVTIRIASVVWLNYAARTTVKQVRARVQRMYLEPRSPAPALTPPPLFRLRTVPEKAALLRQVHCLLQYLDGLHASHHLHVLVHG
jgi:hypothetical protein